MIPIKLTVSNFLSYGEKPQTLDFSTFKIACLIGANGMGKSALLDAMTWALWGEARKASKAKNVSATRYIMRNDSTYAFVEFDFEVEGVLYRVKREATRNSKGTADKAILHIIDADGNPISQLSELHKKHTDAKIIEHLGLDFETFLNSAYLAQGKADEFTKRDATSRIEVIRKVLNLDRYLPFEEEAKNRLTKIKAENQSLTGQLSRLELDIAQEGTRKEELAAALDLLSVEENQLNHIKQAYHNAVEALQVMKRQQDVVVQLQKQQQKRQNEQEEQQQMLQKNQQKIAEIEALLADETHIRAQNELYLANRQIYEAQLEKRSQHQEVQQQISECNLKIEAARHQQQSILENLKFKLQQADKKVQDLIQKIEQKPETIQKLNECQAAESYIAEAESTQKKVQFHHQEIKSLESAIQQKLIHLQSQIQEKRLQFQQRKSLWDTIEAKEQLLKKQQHVLEQIQSTEAQMLLLDKERMDLREDYAKHKSERAQKRQIKAQIEHKQALMLAAPEGDCPTCGNRLDEPHRQKTLAEYAAELKDLEETDVQLGNLLNTIQQKGEQLKNQLEKAQKELQNLRSIADTHTRTSAELDSLKKQVLSFDTLDAEIADLRRLKEDNFSEDSAKIDAHNKAIQDLGFDVERYQSARSIHGNKSLFEKSLAEIQIAEEALPLSKEQLKQHQNALHLTEQTLQAEAFALPERAALAQLQTKLTEIGFESSLFETTKAKDADLKPFHTKFITLSDATAHLDGYRKVLKNTQVQLRKIETEIAQLGIEITQKIIPEDRFSEANHAVVAFTQKVQQQEQVVQRCVEKKAGIETQLAEIDKKKLDLEKLQDENQALTRTIRIHEGLREAFGKNGIPIIEIHREAPQIEQYANEILETLRSSSSIRIDTQKEKSDGTKANTLDIEITDAQGNTRPYEMFSGGEAFRINFALRIALAYALAARKGIRIRTLIIDEGFGTLDQEGIQAMRDAIFAIQERFDKILVITHLEELKDAFPTRIEVYKDAKGSKFYVTET